MMRSVQSLRRTGWFSEKHIDPRFRDAVFLGLGAHPGSNHFHDSSDFGNHGSLVNGPQWEWSEELGRWGMRQSSGSAYIRATTPAYAATAPRAFSIWFREDMPSSTAAFIFLSGSDFFHSSILGLGFFNPATAALFSQNQSWDIPRDAHWHHLLWQHNGTEQQVYRDGVFVTPIGDTSANVNANQADLNIGARNNTGSLSFPGSYADPLIFPRALSADDIWWLAQRENHPIVPLRERWFAKGPSFQPAWARGANNLIGGYAS